MMWLAHLRTSMTLLDHLVLNMLARHPLPWRIDYDWMVEVYDANDALVVKLHRDAMARDLISQAERLKNDSDEFALEFERMMQHEPAF